MITPYTLNQVIKRKAGSGGGTPGVGLNYYWNGTELGVKREDEEDYTFVDLKGDPGSNGIDGDDGREIELQVTATYIQWRYVGDVSWTNLIALSSLKGADGADGVDGTNGADGKQVQLQKSATHIQWKYDTDVTWTDLVALADLKGADGADGVDGAPGADGQGVPVGGTTGQVLKKKTNADFDTEWGEAASGGITLLDVYPVGSIYLSVNNTNPGTLFGGTWVAWGTGRVPVGVDTSDTNFNTVEKTGGHKELQSHTHSASSNSAGAHTHSASSNSAGAHTHTASSNSTGAHAHTIRYRGFTGLTPGIGYDLLRRIHSDDPYDGTNVATNNTGAHTHTITVNSGGGHSHAITVNSGGGHSHTITIGNEGNGNSGNLQPYITCYMWKRTA
jgi:hypothetical protein